MLTFRPFRNADPPLLAALWRSRLENAGHSQPIDSNLLEQLVFAKQYFDYNGLIIASDSDRPVGFAHAGFGPDGLNSRIAFEQGVTCLISTVPGCDEDAVAEGLLERCEQYLISRGAKTLQGGGSEALNPFYVGLYGGSDLPGVLDSDLPARRAFQTRGYQKTERILLMRCNLDRFETAIDRRQMKIRRSMSVEVFSDAPTDSWWEACVFGEYERIRFELKHCRGGPTVAAATFRDMSPAGSASLGRAMGLLDVVVNVENRRAGLAMFLLDDAFRLFRRQGVTSVELQISQSDTVARAVFSSLGFQPVEEGGVWRKEVDS